MRHVAFTALSQMSQAGVSFLGTLLFVHALGPRDFGVYAASLTIGVVFMSAARSILGEQLIAGNSRAAGYLDLTILLTAVALFGVGMAVATLDTGLLLAVLYVVLFVASDAVRYYEISRAEIARVLLRLNVIDLSRVALVGIGLAFSIVGESMIAIALALGSGIIWLIRGAMITGVPKLRLAGQFLGSLGRFEAATAAQFAVGTLASQAIPFVALAAYGAAEFGSLKLAQSLCAPIALLGTAFVPALIRHVASRGDFEQQVRAMQRGLQIALVTSFVASVVAVAAIQFVGPFLVPAPNWGTVALLIPQSVIATALVLVGQPGGALIRVRQMARLAVLGQLAGVAAAWVLALITVAYGLPTFAWAMTLGSALTVASTYILLFLRIARHKRRG